MKQSTNTIRVLPSSSKKGTIYSKRDVPAGSRIESREKKPKQGKEEKGSKSPKLNEVANKAEKAKRKRKAIESDQESEDLCQVPNPELYIAPIPEVYKNSNGREEKDPKQKDGKTAKHCD